MTTSRSHRALPIAAALAGAAGLVSLAARSRPEPPERATPEPPALPPGRVLAVPGRGELFVRDTGPPAASMPGERDGADVPTVLLLHGWMFPADANWFTCYEPLGASARVIALDHRGHGRGLRPAEPFRLTDAADDAAALLHHLDAAPAVVVGYSMGGAIAQLLWQRHPETVRGLVLCATSSTFSATPRQRRIWRTMGALQLLLRLLPRHVWERAVTAQARGSTVRITRLIHEDTPAEVVELLPWIVGELARGSAEDVAEAGRELGRFDARAWLGSVDVPTAVLVTTRDQLVSPDNQRDLAARIPGAVTDELALDHDGVVAGADVFSPALVKAVEQVVATAQDSRATR